jgi:hypothetical protein
MVDSTPCASSKPHALLLEASPLRLSKLCRLSVSAQIRRMREGPSLAEDHGEKYTRPLKGQIKWGLSRCRVENVENFSAYAAA